MGCVDVHTLHGCYSCKFAPNQLLYFSVVIHIMGMFYRACGVNWLLVNEPTVVHWRTSIILFLIKIVTDNTIK